jgi:DNA replication and repair protein RecF
MIIKTLNIHQFKNYDQRSFSFSNKINCFVGSNGIGKTNILEAIHYLALTKGFSSSHDKYNIQFGKEFFILDAQVEKEEGEDTIQCIVHEGRKKRIKRNDYEFQKITEYIGYLPIVMISPYDRNLISDGSESRRKYFDSILSQVDKAYLQDLVSYQKTLQQRNTLLKFFVSNNIFNPAQLEVYNEQLTHFGKSIYEKRAKYLEEIQPILMEKYAQIAQKEERISCTYQSQLSEKDFLQLLKEKQDKDRFVQYTSVGIHRDDYIFEINGRPIKRFGSQGQQKSFLIALKLAQYEYLKRFHKDNPILLLDDVFDKLDAQRVQAIVDLVNQDYFGQIFITDTHKDRMENLLSKLEVNYQLFALS